MTWRVALIWGVRFEALLVGILALYHFRMIPPGVFGGIRSTQVAYVLHLPGALLSLPTFWLTTNMGGLSALQGFLATAIVAVALQVVFLAALAFGVVRHPKISAAAALALVATALAATVSKTPPYPDGMDANRDRFVSMDEWISFHADHPRFYGGFDQSGYITKGSADYYEREFERVDCNHDTAMDAFEYGELHWNLRWCTSPDRPPRPWWK